MFQYRSREKKIEGKQTVDKKKSLLSLVLDSSSAFEEIKFEKDVLTIWCPSIRYQVIRNENGRNYEIFYLWHDSLEQCAPNFVNVKDDHPEHRQWHNYKEDESCHVHYKNKKNEPMSIDELKCFLQKIIKNLSQNSNCKSNNNPRGIDCKKQRKHFKKLLEEYSNFVNDSEPKVIENKKIDHKHERSGGFFETCYDIADQYFEALCDKILCYSTEVINQCPSPSIYDSQGNRKPLLLNQCCFFNTKNCLQSNMQSLPQPYHLGN